MDAGGIVFENSRGDGVENGTWIRYFGFKFRIRTFDIILALITLLNNVESETCLSKTVFKESNPLKLPLIFD